MKLKLEDKLEIIRKSYEEGFSVPQLAMEYNVGQSTVKRIRHLYNMNSLLIFKSKEKNNKYPLEFKLKIINRVKIGESISYVANSIGIGDGMIHSWLKKFNEMGYNGLNHKKGRPRKMKPDNNIKDKQSKQNENLDDKDREIQELKERNAQLEMELDLLKKLRALVQQRTQQQNKKK